MLTDLSNWVPAGMLEVMPVPPEAAGAALVEPPMFIPGMLPAGAGVAPVEPPISIPGIPPADTGAAPAEPPTLIPGILSI